MQPMRGGFRSVNCNATVSPTRSPPLSRGRSRSGGIREAVPGGCCAMRTRHTLLIALAVVLLAWPMAAAPPAGEPVDLDAVYRIKDEGLARSTVMHIESYLTDVYGPRLTGSPNIKEAADWAQKTMKEWGLANVHLETWPFGRGWQNQMFLAHARTPRAYPLIGYP